MASTPHLLLLILTLTATGLACRGNTPPPVVPVAKAEPLQVKEAPASSKDAAWVSLSGLGTMNFLGAWGSAPADVWFVNVRGGIVHYDGKQWTLQSTGTQEVLWEVWGAKPDDLWVGGNNDTWFHSDGTGWKRFTDAPKSSFGGASPRGFWGASPNDVWCVGTHNLLAHWDGQRWTPHSVPAGEMIDFAGIWGSGAQDIWAVGRGLENNVWHWNGKVWAPIDGLPELRAIHGSAANDVWAAGNGVVAYFDGTKWSTNRIAGWSSNAVWVGSKTDAWIVGQDGFTSHWDGASWASKETPGGKTLYAVWGSGPSNVWAVGADGTVLHHQ